LVVFQTDLQVTFFMVSHKKGGAKPSNEGLWKTGLHRTAGEPLARFETP
jgi:hypothetical protein